MRKTEMIANLKKNFDDHANDVDGTELWFARDLQTLLAYNEWRKFEGVIDKAISACRQSGNDPDDHFIDAVKMSETGKGAQRKIKDFLLTRYACYLVAQNGDPRKREIAFAMTYFALQTRKMEVLEQRFGEIERLIARERLTEEEKILSKLAFERGVDGEGMSRIRNRGDRALFRISTAAMKKKVGAPRNRPLADFLPRLTIAGKAFATELTNATIERDDLQGESKITGEHVGNNQTVRGIMVDKGFIPENLPPAEDIKKVGRRVKKDEKKLSKNKQ